MKQLDTKILVLSDIHLGHPRNTTSNIINNLLTFFDRFSPVSKYTELDMIIIAGDLFDSLLDLDGSDGFHSDIVIFLTRLISFCSKHGIKLRVLKGTPSHDWEQPRIVETLANVNKILTNTDIEPDVKYINALHVEYVKDLKLHILYVPDEWSVDASSTYQQVRAKLKELNIDQVDLAIMHGMFNYQLQGVGNSSIKHDEQSYLDIVKYYICVGHIHIHSVYDRIIAPGSFDRLSHGEEEPKGGILLTLGESPSYAFISNLNAMLFKTIDVRFNDRDKAIQQLDKAIAHLPEGSYVRVRCKKDHPVYIGFDEIKQRYLYQNLSKIPSDKDPYKQDLSSIPTYTTIDITKDNIVQLLMDSITTNHDIPEHKQTILKNNLESLV